MSDSEARCKLGVCVVAGAEHLQRGTIVWVERTDAGRMPRDIDVPAYLEVPGVNSDGTVEVETEASMMVPANELQSFCGEQFGDDRWLISVGDISRLTFNKPTPVKQKIGVVGSDIEFEADGVQVTSNAGEKPKCPICDTP